MILPVFAGMVPAQTGSGSSQRYSPRIRGDGPYIKVPLKATIKFSLYLRGWCHQYGKVSLSLSIFPVFAGMIPAFRTIDGKLLLFLVAGFVNLGI